MGMLPLSIAIVGVFACSTSDRVLCRSLLRERAGRRLPWQRGGRVTTVVDICSRLSRCITLLVFSRVRINLPVGRASRPKGALNRMTLFRCTIRT